MNTSQNKLQEYIELYLNDLEDYGEDAEYILAEIGRAHV
jgi:predicted DNA-binding protein